MLRLAIQRLISRIFVSMAVACLAASGSAAAFAAGENGAESLTPAELLTPSTAAYVEISDPKALLELAWSERTTALLEKLPQAQKAYESKQFRDLTTVVGVLEAKLGTAWKAAVATLTGGGVTLAFDASDQAVFLFIESNDEDLLISAHDEVISLIEADAERKGAPSPVKSTEYGGETGYSFGKNEAHVRLGKLLVVSNKAESLKSLIDRRNARLEKSDKPAKKRSLAEDETFQTARKHAAQGDAGFAFVRLAPLRLMAGMARAFGPEKKADNLIAELLAGGVLDAVGHADYAAATLRLDDAGLRLAAHLPHEHGQTAKTRTWFFAPKPGQSAAPALEVPGTIATFTAYRDVSGMWMARNELFDEKTNVGLTQADTNLGLYFSGRDFGSQVLGELEPQWRFIAAQREFGVDGEPVPALKLPAFALVWELKHPEKFGPHLQLAFQNIIGITNIDGAQKGRPQLLMKTETLGDAEIQAATYLAVEETVNDAGPIHFNFRPACARVGKYFVIGTHVGVVRELAKQLGKETSVPTTSDSLVFDVRLPELARILEANRPLIVGRTLLAAGGDREKAEEQLDLGLETLRLLESAGIRLVDGEQALMLETTLRTLAK
ncbi:MAG: hypothetical protein C0483_08150 [Pirellula sp.]|nr:hypothetical protein [Pirellula sp.]